MGPRSTLANVGICKQNFSKDCGSKGVYEPVCHLSRKWGKKSVECKPGQIPKGKEFVEVQSAIQRIPACYRSRIKTSWDHSRGKKSPVTFLLRATLQRTQLWLWQPLPWRRYTVKAMNCVDCGW